PPHDQCILAGPKKEVNFLQDIRARRRYDRPDIAWRGASVAQAYVARQMWARHAEQEGMAERMALELYMVGLIVRDMRAAVAFYRHLGLEIPEGSEERRFVEIKMGGMSFFLDATAAEWDPGYAGSPEARVAAEVGKHGHLLEFNLLERK